MKRTPLRRKIRIKLRNPARAAEHLARDFGEQAKRCRQSLCCVCLALGNEQIGESVPHHDPSRGAGGTDRDCVPLCSAHHAQVHVQGRESFWREVRVSIDAVKSRMREGAVLSWAEVIPA